MSLRSFAKTLLWTALASAGVVGTPPLRAQPPEPVETLPTIPAAAVSGTPEDFSELDLEALLDIPVTSVSRKLENLKDAAAAIYVISGDELRRLGIHTLPEALRLAPGLHVAQINANDYGITARGLNRGVGANKLEVLVDGRSIYTPLFSGVLWDQQFALVEDIERIEVIRGPGGTLWGANAVNGVINVVSARASETVGTAVQAAGGDHTRYFGAARLSMGLGESGHGRIYAQSYRLDRFDNDDARAHDGLRMAQGGFRGDFQFSASNTLTLHGDVFDTQSEESPSIDTTISGGDLAAAWTLVNDAQRREWMVRGYLDQYDRDTPGVFGEKRATAQVEVLLRQGLGQRHDVVSGLNYRYTADETAENRAVIFNPASRTLNTVGAFVQDEIALIPARWSLAFGAKLEHNDLSGIEIQPSVRSAYAASAATTVWGAVSRAVRIPNRVDHDLAFDTAAGGDASGTPVGDVPGAPQPSQQCQVLPQNPACPEIRGVVNALFPPAPGGIVSTGNPDFESEEVLAFELGYRGSLADTLSLDAAAFFNRYDQLQSREADNRVGNGLEGSTQGVELLLRWQAAANLRLHLDATALQTQIKVKPGSTDPSGDGAGNDPDYYGGLRLAYDPTANTTLDAYLRHVGALSSGQTPGYTELNLGASWAARPWLRLRFAGQNLLREDHREFGGGRIGRALKAQLELRW